MGQVSLALLEAADFAPADNPLTEAEESMTGCAAANADPGLF